MRTFAEHSSHVSAMTIRSSARPCVLLVLGIAMQAHGAPKVLPDARAAKAYEYAVVYQGLVEPVKLEWQGLPDWLSADGPRLHGTPSTITQKPLEFAVTLTGQLGKQLKGNFSLSVRPAIRPLALVKSTLPPLSIDEPVSVPFVATGGEGKLEWHTQWIERIPGIDVEIDNRTGTCRLTGTASAKGDFQIDVVVRDETGASDQHRFRGQVRSLAPPLRIATTNLPRATFTYPYDARLVAEGGRPPYTWTIQWRNFPPPGLEVIRDDGRIEGVPTHLGTYSCTITLDDADATRVQANTELTVVAPKCKAFLVERKLPTATVGRTFEATLCAGGLIGEAKWAISGAPSWLRYETADQVACHLSGVPTESGTLEITATLTLIAPVQTASGESVQQIGSASRTFTLRVSPKNVPRLELIQLHPPVAVQNLPFRYCFASHGGEEPVHFTFTDGLPSSVTTNPNGCIRTENTRESGVFKFAVVATSADGQKQRFDTELRVMPGEPSEPLKMSDMYGLNGLFFQKTVLTVPVRGGVPPYTVDMDYDKGLETLHSDVNEWLAFRLRDPLGVRAWVTAHDSSGSSVRKQVRIRPVVPLEHAILAIISLVLLYAAKVYISFHRRRSLVFKKPIQWLDKSIATNEYESE